MSIQPTEPQQQEEALVASSNTRSEKWVFMLSTILAAASWAIMLFAYPYREQPLILHYNTTFGIDFSGPWWYIFAYPVAATVVLGIAFFLRRRMTTTDGAHHTLSTVLFVFSSIILVGILAALYLLLPFNTIS